MKTAKRLSILFALLLVVSLAVVGFSVNASGNEIVVTNEAEFKAAMVNTNASATIILANDITLTNGNTIMDSFTGIFDGQGHTVEGLTSTLFKSFGGTFKNVTLKGDITTNERWPATICYEAKLGNSVIENVVSYANITSECGNINAGGLVGYTKYGFIMRNCEYAGTFNLTWANTNAGYAGLVGWSNTGGSEVIIEDSVFSGELILNSSSSGQMYLGGIIGHAGSSAAGVLIKNCANNGKITIKDTNSTGIWLGGIAGKFNGNNKHTIDSCVNNGKYAYPSQVSLSGMIGLLEDDASIGSTIKNSVSLYDDGEYCALPEIRDANFVDSYLASDVEKIGDPIEIDGVMYQKYNFGYLEVATSKLADFSVSFEEGVITETADGKYTIGTNTYSAFLSARNGTELGTLDYRFIIAANYDKLMTNPNLKLKLTFTNGLETVKTLTKDIRTELHVYSSATAAGNLYTAAEGTVFTGIVVKDVPTLAWDTVVLELVTSEGEVICDGEAKADDVYASGLKVLSGMLTDFEGMTEDELVLGHLDGSLKNLMTVSGTVVSGKGVGGSSALAACRTEWYSSNTDNNMEVKWQLSEPGLLGDNAYLVVWMDLATNNLEFRKACFGLLTDGQWTSPYRADDKEAGCHFYYKADGSDTWVEKTMGSDGCFGAGDSCPVAGYKGYFAFPISDMYSGKTTLKADSAISGVYFYMCANSSEMTGKPVYVDNIQLVTDYKTVQ